MFSPAYIEFAQDYPEVPRLTPAPNEALDLYGGVASKEGWRDVNEFRARRRTAKEVLWFCVC